MATDSRLSVPDQIRQLSDARKLVLGDVSYYGQVIQATLPIFGPSAHVELRRWGADFLAEAFATPAVPLGQKETLSLLILDTLKDLVEDPNQDVLVLRSVILTAASVYPLAMRWIISNAYDTNTWKNITAIKARILTIWENAPLTLRICCVKFAQRVILAQTPSINPEPRRGDPLDISLNMVPRDHSVLNVNAMEAEATGLLDRVLSVLQENNSDVLTLDATLNSLSILIRMRPMTSNKVLNAILSFNPLKLANAPMTAKTKVIVRSLEKTTRMLCMHLSRRYVAQHQLSVELCVDAGFRDTKGVLAQRMQPYLDRLSQARAEMQEGTSRKRAMTETADGIEAKRQRTAPNLPDLQITPLPPGPHSLADIFTFTQNEGLRNFDVALVPATLAAKVSVNTIARIDPHLLDRAINGVRDRLAELHKSAVKPLNPDTTALDVEDDDDYEPDYYAAEDNEQILNKLDSEPSVQRGELQKPAVLGTLALPTFKLPPPPVLEPEQAVKVGQGTVTRVFGVMSTLDDPSTKKTKAGINRLAASSFDRESWITIITRLATRAAAGLDDISIKDEDASTIPGGISLGNSIRESLYVYVLEDFRKRIDIAVSWLSEEWYNDRVQQKAASEAGRDIPLHYDKWALRLIEGFIPYLHAQDKVLTRFLSEIPSLNVEILGRVKTLCRDPSTVNLALTSLLYLVMMRPPVREIALDAVQDIWLEYDEARAMAGKYLTKWRPGFMEHQKQLLATNGNPTGGGQAMVAT
ncbi:putative Symplekin/Pta1 N-terminal domain-containing protein [Seiridium unicorne]|uniref:Symplekin/Pta1 N-terminal domain-containing protein n=1 Tax=Seiridium unicorne TaxID=138068 RepID=A0ABR2UTZ5_9PEZI